MVRSPKRYTGIARSDSERTEDAQILNASMVDVGTYRSSGLMTTVRILDLRHGTISRKI
jgi:hypothetical protein